MTQAAVDDSQLVEKLRAGHGKILEELRKVIVAQDAVVDQVMISLMVGAHSIITGVPGLAKTLIIKTIADIMDLKFKRIQFTPDLMPADITGTDIIQEDVTTGKRELVFVKGPIFTNILLADEINRTPPKTQAALLEAMEELQVTIQGVTYPMDRPFFVLATQNPIELEGTYPLPEAQLDRLPGGRRRAHGDNGNNSDAEYPTRTCGYGGRSRCIPAIGSAGSGSGIRLKVRRGPGSSQSSRKWKPAGFY
jgi:MoxR-like ATPase